MTAKVGDTVRFLNSVGGGTVVRVAGNMAYVDEDGFETPALLKDCVVVATGDTFYKKEKAQKGGTPQPPSKDSTPPPAPTVAPFVPTAEGERINLVVAFEPADIKHLSETSFDAFLVNDSNYSMYVSVATRPNESDTWTLRYAGFVEPAIQEFLFELTTDDLPYIDRISVQAIPFKRDETFRRKNAVDFEQRLDATRFARLHCFDSSEYFDTKVLSIDIVRDDVAVAAPRINAADLKEAMERKARDDRRASRPVMKKPHEHSNPNTPLEIDLHAGALLDNLNGLSKADILNFQIDTFRKVLDQNSANIGKKIIFIHGKGEGVLRNALMKELNYRYKHHEVCDASFREYGFGATQVTIRKAPAK